MRPRSIIVSTEVAKAMDEEVIKFIEAVERWPVLYDNTDKFYSDRDVQYKVWKEVARDMDNVMSGLACKERWRNIRAAYTRSLTPKSNNKTSRAKKKYYLAEHLEFLLPFTKIKEQKPRATKPSLKKTGKPIPKSENDKDSEIEDKELHTVCKIEDDDDNQNASSRTIIPKSSSSNALPIASTSNGSAVQSNDLSNKRKEIDPLEICAADEAKKQRTGESEDANLNFLKSLLPDLHRMTDYQRYEFRCKTMKLVGEILYRPNQANN